MAKILIVEDTGMLREALRRSLKADGHEIVEAADGNAGVSAFLRERPDLTILDRDLPGLSGSEVLQRIRDSLPNAAVFVLTSYADPQGEAKYRALGVSAFLSKDIGIDKLRELVGKHFDRLERRPRPAAPPPKPAPESGPEASPKAAAAPSSSGGEGAGVRILVIDDDEHVRRILKRFLERKGYAVRAAEDGEEGLAAHAEFKPHLILLDVQMPKMDGVAFLKKLRETDEETSVMMITGNKDLETARSCFQLGVFDYVLKPFDLDYLETTVAAKILLIT